MKHLIICIAIALVLIMFHSLTMSVLREHERVREDYGKVLDKAQYIENRFIEIKDVAIRARKGGG